ncbi:hypothetical protein L6452_08907 [Arctium lappa]|uniref:Uncharacterized protein n=1 Tax=Arctium lappa TaxID=4217 RepID=A0ACB9DJ24_ARCLA|nr:hypothetical protein L6452_08907 [Arctium lappa]
MLLVEVNAAGTKLVLLNKINTASSELMLLEEVSTAEHESNSTLVSKVPMLKPSEFDMWKIRIRQYILLTDYSIWDIIENGPSEAGKIGPDGKRPPPKTDGERKIRQTEMKALSTLLLAIPNEYQHQFCNCTDAQIFWNALEKRFAGTKSIKRNQRDVLKQQYENFTSSKNESMTQTFDRFNKLIGELATVGVKMEQDDINRNHSNNSLINDDLDQLHPDDLEEMDIKWQMAMLSMRVKKSVVPNNNHQQAQNGGYNQNKNPAQALVSQQGMGFDWSDQAEEAIQNQALMAEVSDLPSEVISNLCTQSCIDTVKRYRDHNQSMCDDLKRLEKDRRDYVLIVERFEEQIKGFQANELQHSYDTNYWKWEKNELETKLSKSLEENNRLKEELSKVKLDIEKFSYASKAMDSLIKAQIHDKMKPGVGYNNTPPPYNNNYIPPTSDLLETKEKKDLSEEAFKIDPLDEVVVKDLTEKEASENRDNAVSKEIPLENNIITNEGCGKIWVKSKEIEKTKGKDNKINFQRFVQKPVGYRKAGKKHVMKKSVDSKGPMKNKVLKESVLLWVPRSTNSVSTAENISDANTVTTANSVSTAKNINAANTVTTANKVSTAKHASAARAVSTSKTSTASSNNVSKPIIVTKYSKNEESKFKNLGNQQLKEKSIWHVDSGCSRHMTGNMSCLQDFKHINGGHVAFGDNLTGGKISGKGNVTKGFKVVDESMILLRTPRKDNVYCLDMDNVYSDSSLNCLVSKASVDESSLWHRRMCHMNFKTMNKLVKNNLVRGLPSKLFSCDDHCVACLKGKQHKTSHKTKEINSISSCLQLLHMDLFGPTNVISIGKKSYCLVIVDDYSRFTWVYFLRTKDETSGLIKSFILRIENQTNQKVKVIRSDNGTEFKNLDLNTFCEEKGIERQYSAPRTPQQNGVAEKRNRTLIEVARSLLVDSKLPIIFWAEAVNTACYVQNRVLVVKQKNKTPYELLNKRKPFIGFFKPFGCPCTILNTKSHLGTGSGGSGTTQVSESISQSVIFHIPTVDPVEDCEKEPSTGPSQSEEESRDEETQENKEPEVATENTSVELNDSNLEVGLNEEPSHHTRIQKNHPPQLLKPKKAHDAMKESSWIEAMQEELLQFKLNKRDERGIVIRNKARLVAQEYTQEEGIDYEEVFAPVARIEAIRLFLAYASYMKFKVYQMDVKSAFLYGSIEEEVYVCQPPGFENPSYPDRVYKLKKALYGLHQAPRAWYDTLSSYLLENGFERGVIDKTLFIKRKKKDILLVQIYVDDIIFGSTRDNMCKEFEELMHQRFKMSSMGELTFFLGLQVQQKSDGIFICQSKYVQDILTKFGFSDSKPASTPMETHKQITADLEGEDMDVHHYRSMIGSLMYLTASRPDIMFPVCVCARFQVRPKQSHYQAVKRIFRYLKGQPRLGLWYPHDSSFDLLAYSDSDLGGANLDRKSTSGGCQFLGARLVSWQCKKQTTVSTSTTEAEYIAAASCYSQVLWIQNQMLDYGVTFLHTPIFIDNSSAISIVNNPVKHSKTKHIEIRYHFIRDCNEKKLIQVVKVHTDNQFADLFTKAFDVGRFTFLDMYSSTQCFARLKEQFWAHATIVTEDGVQMIKTTVCGKPLTVTEEVIRISLRLDDASGITSISNDELFSTLTRMGYGGPLGIFKFSKAKFSPQWRFHVHTLMHCISKKTTGWSEFSSPIAYALVCLTTARRYNFSQMIFNDLVSNMGNKKSFYMYPRFVQAVINHELTDIPHSEGIYVPKPPKGKVFSNMRRSSGDSERVDTPLFSTMMVVSQTNEGMVAGSRPPLDQPTASQSQPSHSKSIPQSLLDKLTSPITQTYQRKQVKKAPSLLVPSPTQPLSPLRENSPLENIQRETNRVSPNPQEVLSKEMDEHMGEKAATTSASTDKASGNISKTFPMATLNEQSFKGPRCQETKGVDSASARQKASTTKRSHDPSKGGNTPGEGEDRYDYNELMETMGNINMDVIKQGKEIEEMKLVILSQQVQIARLKKMVTRLVQKKRRKQFELRKSKYGIDAPKKGEINMEEATKEGELDGMKYGVEGEKAAVSEQAAETINAASSSGAAEMVTTADMNKAAETVKEVLTELEIAETLIKAKHDTLKVTSKAKGVIIKERGDVAMKSRSEKVLSKEKGKAKLVDSESDQPMKRQKLIEADEALARKIQAELEQAENVQVEKDREIAKAMAAELNKAYQQSLATEIAQKKVATLKKSVVVKTAVKKRQPSKTFLGTQERKKMIIFLKGAVGVRKEMFSKMSFEKIKELYDSEMLKLQGNETARVEMEKRMKESNDFLIQKPFPDEQETPPKKEATLGESLRTLKRTKMMERRKSTKKPRVDEGEDEKVAEEEGAPESSKQKEP